MWRWGPLAAPDSLIDFTGVTAVPQIFLQSYAYASAAVPLTPAGERLVIASISFSLLSLLRSICGLLASWRKIRFTFQRVNGNLEAEVFNGCLHECADAAERTTSPQSRKRFIAFFLRTGRLQLIAYYFVVDGF